MQVIRVLNGAIIALKNGRACTWLAACETDLYAQQRKKGWNSEGVAPLRKEKILSCMC
jgi:hypothetical protein